MVEVEVEGEGEGEGEVEVEVEVEGEGEDNSIGSGWCSFRLVLGVGFRRHRYRTLKPVVGLMVELTILMSVG